MKRLAIIGMGLCWLLSQDAMAQKKISAAPKASGNAVWNKEPDAFLGIKFGEPLSSATRYCPDYSSIKMGDSVCLKATSISDYFEVENLPSIGFWYDVSLRLQGGRPVWFSITSLRQDFGRLEAAFFDRYGLPTVSRGTTVQTLGGAAFQSQTYSWIGNRVQIEMSERSGTIDKSSVMISDLILSREKMQKNQEISKRGAEKF